MTKRKGVKDVGLKELIALVLLSIYPEGAGKDGIRAHYSEFFPGMSMSTYYRYHRQGHDKLRELGFTNLDGEVSAEGFAYLIATTPGTIIPQAITRLREFQEKCGELDGENFDLKMEILELEDALESAKLTIITYNTQIAQLSHLESEREKADDLIIPSSIRSELEREGGEAVKCVQAGLYNQAVGTCGKILEIVLHERYEELKRKPLPEKESLGRIIRRFKEEGLDLSPDTRHTLTYINQMRNVALHKKGKRVALNASQANMLIGFTYVVIDKLYAKG